MSQTLYYVPWASYSEWADVKEKIVSGDISNIAKAYQTLLLWKFKTPNVPAYVECTMRILQVMLQEHNRCAQTSDILLLAEQDVRLSYSTALIRFVNHVSSVSSFKGDSLYLAAKSQNIPDWIINLRHDAAHGQELPSLDALQTAASVSLQWLLDNYWNVEQNAMLEYHSNIKSGSENSEVLKQALNLWKACFDGQKNYLKFVADLPQDTWSSLSDLILTWHETSVSKKRKVKLCFQELNNIRNGWEEFLRKVVRQPNDRKKTARIKSLRQALLNMITVIYSKCTTAEKLVSFLVASEFTADDVDPQEWLDVVHVLQRIKAVPLLLKALLTLAAGEGSGHGAFRWLAALAPAMTTLRAKWPVYQQLRASDTTSSTSALKETVRKLDLNGSELALEVHEPPTISLEDLKQGLLNPDRVPKKILFVYLKLVEPRLPAANNKMMKQLVRIFNGKVVFDSDLGDRTFSVEDLPLDAGREADHSEEEEDGAEMLWTRSKLSSDTWSRHGLGLLPHQTVVDCKLPSDLTWGAATGLPAKRKALPVIGQYPVSKRRKAFNCAPTDISV